MTRHGVEGKVVIVTGAGRGIGRGIAHHVGKSGARLCISDKRAERLAQVAAELEALGIEQLALECDVGSREALGTLARCTAERFGRIDGIVNNAQGLRPTANLEDVTPETMDVLLDTGPKATLWAMQAVFPYMRAQRYGRIVNVASAAGLTGAAGYGAYSAAKEAIRALTRTAAREWGCHGIIVNCYCPASVAHRKPPGDAPSHQKAVYEMYRDHPLGRDGDAEHDIAPVVQFLLSDACQYMTGETLKIDGGAYMCP
jgi:NAD(P)-dependent dehydrogenase (short-subunit alcohol dehydrogenase family)